MNFNQNNVQNKQDICSVCEAEPEDMLILTCRHNLCLECATQVYNLNSKQDVLVCEICLSQTRLDNQTVLCLRSLSTRNYQNSLKQNVLITNRTGEFVSKSNKLPMSIPNRSVIKNNHELFEQAGQQQQQSSQNQPIKCVKHNQPLVYFCFDCNTYKICSQCMIVENHHYDHKIMTLKRSKQFILKNIDQLCEEKMKLKRLLENDMRCLIDRKQQSERQFEMNLRQIQQGFNQVMLMIQGRFRQMRELMQKDSKRKIEIMQGAINQISQKIMLIEQTIQFEGELVASSSVMLKAKNQYQLFEYYTNELSREISMSYEPSLPSLIPEIKLIELNRDYYMPKVRQIVEKIKFVYDGEDDGDEDGDNIHYMSQIGEEENENPNLRKEKDVENRLAGEKGENYSKYNQYNNDVSQHKSTAIRIQNHRKKQLSQNINIVHNPITNKSSKTPSHNNKPSSNNAIEAIKLKARENIKNKQLVNSRKLQLSRSLLNANDILNKIQQRSMKI